ncbi:MAG: 3'-5' exonuclease [Peltula sp. TS41687]|nr:MAG: 3'-5' exonuclease [Peltula sp. TS41687]
MELKDLSANWKKLQQTLKGKPDLPESRKRKAETHDLQGQKSTTKRQRFIRDGQTKETVVNGKKSKKDNMITTNGQVKNSSASLAAWAEDNDIPAADLTLAYGPGTRGTTASVATPERINEGLSTMAAGGKYIAIDCEMVGVGGEENERSVLARASIVNFHGEQIYDSFVKPKEYVTDWRTWVSGVAPKHMVIARDFETVQRDIAELIRDRILVGHAVHHDLDALLLSHPKRNIRDTSRHPAFRLLSAGRTPALKKLAKDILGIDIQESAHSSVEDARVCMLLYRQNKESFEAEHAKRWPVRPPTTNDKSDSAKKTKQKKPKPKKKKKK